MQKIAVAEFVDRFLDAWNSGDVEKVAACYSENLSYKDPNIKGEICDMVSFKKYLAKLLAGWDMTWESKESFELSDHNGWSFLWRAVIRNPKTDKSIELNGMDLIVLDGELISRNEVYFDRSLLLPLMQV